MKPVLLISCLFFACVSFVRADDVVSAHVQTTPPPTARYEIVQSPLAARWTFRLDRFSGRISQLVNTEDAGVTWQDMEVIGLPTTTLASKPRFQIFSSALAVRHTYLLDTETGNTWQVVTGKESSPDGTEYEVNLWEPLAR